MKMRTAVLFLACVVLASAAEDCGMSALKPTVCSNTTFWGYESGIIMGDFCNPQDPPNTGSSTSGHEPHFPQLWTNPPGGICPPAECADPPYNVSCVCTLVSEPLHHTASLPDNTPVVLAFPDTFNCTNFIYSSLPTECPSCVWNGADSFTYNKTCTDDSGETAECGTLTTYINVFFESASMHRARKASATMDVETSGNIYCKAGGDCPNGKWQVTHELPRRWDTHHKDGKTKTDKVLNTAFGDPLREADDLDFEWTAVRNHGIISSYGTIGNLAQRFGSFVRLDWVPGRNLSSGDFKHPTHSLTTFQINCLDNYAASNLQHLNDKQPSEPWYNKFNGVYTSCDNMTKATNCNDRPLLAPASVNWHLEVDSCDTKWVGKFTWANMQQMDFDGDVTTDDKVWHVTENVAEQYYKVYTEFYNTVIQPFSWTEKERGWAEENHLYKLTFKLCVLVEFEFDLGLDIFTMDCESFRYEESDGSMSIGGNCIVENPPGPEDPSAPPCQGVGCTPDNPPSPDVPDRRICEVGVLEVEFEDAHPTYPNHNNITCQAGPATTTGTGVPCASDKSCCTNPAASIVLGQPGLSPPNRQATETTATCDFTMQNVTIRCTAANSKPCGPNETPAQDNCLPADPSADGFTVKFCGCARIKMMLCNWENVNFKWCVRLLCTSICTEGTFASSTATCRGSFYWPVFPAVQALPDVLCEEVDARTFGPHDWAIVMFDIHDVARNDTIVKSATVDFSIGTGDSVATTLTLVLVDTENVGNVNIDSHQYLNFVNLCTDPKTECSKLERVDAEAIADPFMAPPQMDWGFAWTPGAYNENVKITIKVVLKILSTQFVEPKNRRWGTLEEKTEAENTAIATMRIDKKRVRSANLANVRQATARRQAAAQGSSTLVMALGALCAVLAVAFVGMAALYIRRRNAGKMETRSSFSGQATKS